VSPAKVIITPAKPVALIYEPLKAAEKAAVGVRIGIGVAIGFGFAAFLPVFEITDFDCNCSSNSDADPDRKSVAKNHMDGNRFLWTSASVKLLLPHRQSRWISQRIRHLFGHTRDFFGENNVSNR
jgi:hypothetical protein